MFVGGELNGAIQLTAAYTDMTSATNLLLVWAKIKKLWN
jgi:hypothetical protein